MPGEYAMSIENAGMTFGDGKLQGYRKILGKGRAMNGRGMEPNFQIPVPFIALPDRFDTEASAFRFSGQPFFFAAVTRNTFTGSGVL